MISVWSRRRVSERASRCHWVLPVLLLIAGTAAADPLPILRLQTDRSSVVMTEWLSLDQAWLRSLPPAERLLLGAGEVADPTGIALRARLLELTRGTRPDSLVILRTLDARLAQRWRRRGHLDVQVAVRPADGADTERPDTLVVVPGGVWTFGDINVEGDDFPGRTHLLGTWLPLTGDRYDADALAADIAQVLSGAGEAGHPWARWMTREVTPDPSRRTVHIQAILLPGAAAYVGPITTSLPPGRAADFAIQTSGLRTGTPYRESDLGRAVDRLLARDLYSRVDTPLVHLTASRDTVGIHLRLVPRPKANRLQVVLGLSRDVEGASRLSGQVDLDMPNLAGTGRALRVGWRDDGDRTSRFGFKYLEPLVLDTPLDTDIALDQEVQRGSYTRIRLDNRWRLPVVALWGIELGLGWDRSTFPTGDLASTRRVRARGAVLHRRGDRSRSGWEGLFAVEEAWRSAVARADTGGLAQLGEAVTQRIFEVDVAGEWRMGRSYGIFGRASYRELSGGPDVAPLSEHFRFGGAASLRGYREDEFHGTRAAWASIELRVGPSRGSRLYTFYDLGYFGFSTEETLLSGVENIVLREGWPRGYGLGILARSRAGDLSLAIGFPGTVDFDQAKLHVTLLESF